MILKTLLCSLLAFALASPAPGSRKCVPEQYEGVALGKVAQVADKIPMVLSLSARFASDYKNQKEAFHEAIQYRDQYNNITINISVIADYSKMSFFYIQHDKRECSQIKMDFPQERFCSDVAQPTSSFIMGDDMVDVFAIDRVSLGQKTRSTITMFRDSFTPVTEIKEHTWSGIPQMVALQFGNITLGIKDERIFNVPSYC